MKNVLNITILLLAGLPATKLSGQCTATIIGGGCEGTTLHANTTDGTLQQLIWKWKSRNDSTVLISTATAYYPGGVIVAGGNGNDNSKGNAADNQCAPEGICLDNAGNLYVVDAAQHKSTEMGPRNCRRSYRCRW